MKHIKSKNHSRIPCAKLNKQISAQKRLLTGEISRSDARIANQARFRYRFFAGSALFCWIISIAVPLFAIIIKSYNTAPAVYGMLSGIGGIIVSLVCSAIFKYRYSRLVGYRELEVIARAKFLFCFFYWFSILSWTLFLGIPLLAAGLNNLGDLAAYIAGLTFSCFLVGIVCFNIFRNKYVEMTGDYEVIYFPIYWG